MMVVEEKEGKEIAEANGNLISHLRRHFCDQALLQMHSNGDT